MSARAYHSLVIAVGLAAGHAIANGVGRLAYGLILPDMLADLGWGYWEAGLVATAAELGNLGGVLLAWALLGRVRPTRLFQFGLIGCAACLIASGAGRDLQHLLVVRFLAGFAAGPVLLAGALLTAAIYVYEPERTRAATTIFHAGVAAGLIVTALLVPTLSRTMGAKAWPEAWLMLGLFASVALPFTFWAAQRVAFVDTGLTAPAWDWRRDVPGLTAFACAGVGVAIVTTFLVLWARRHDTDTVAVGAIWATLGLAGLLAPAFWQPLLPRLATGQRLAAVLALTALGAGLTAFSTSGATFVIAAALFGFGAFMLPAMIADLSGLTTPRAAWRRAIPAFAAVGAAAQAVGTFGGGWMADHTNTLLAPLLAGAALIAFGAVVALAQPATAGGLPTTSGAPQLQ